MGKIFGKNLDEDLDSALLSVIVPIYNVEQYLPKCIESIINQTYQQLEILLIDDGSTDRCPLICDKYAQLDKRIKVIHKVNEGLVRARKSGLNAAAGQYITFVDGDDWIDTEMYLKLMELLKSSDADFADSGFFYDKNGLSSIQRRLEKGLYELNKYNKHKIFLALLDLDNSFDIRHHIWSKIFKSNIIKDSYINVPDSMQYGEDAINMLYCVLKSTKMIQTEGVFYHYNCREESMSHFKSNSYIRKELELWNYCGSIILKNDHFMTQEKLDRCLFQRLYSSFHYLCPNEFDVIQYYSFPCIEELFGKKIVIYGAGKVGKDYLTQISKYEKCEIVCWVDQDYEKLHFKYREVIGVEQLLKKIYDFVLIAVEKKEIADEIKKSLLKKGILEAKILWYKPNTAF